jgi:hypothetical protein
MTAQPRIVIIRAGIVGCALADKITERGLTVDGPAQTVLGSEPVHVDGTPAGYVTSAEFGHNGRHHRRVHLAARCRGPRDGPNPPLVPRQPRSAPSQRPARPLAAWAESPSRPTTRASGRLAMHRTGRRSLSSKP